MVAVATHAKLDCGTMAETRSRQRLFLALAAYAVLGLLALLTLDWTLRMGVWLLLFALAVKTVIASVSGARR